MSVAAFLPSSSTMIWVSTERVMSSAGLWRRDDEIDAVLHHLTPSDTDVERQRSVLVSPCFQPADGRIS